MNQDLISPGAAFTNPPAAHPRSRLLSPLTVLVAVIALGLIGADVFFYLRTTAWQFVASAGALLAGLLLALIANRLARRGQAELAARLVAVELGLAFILHELLLLGASLIFILGGLVVLFAYFRLIWPRGQATSFSRRWPAWLLLYLLAFWLVNRLALLPRFPIQQLPALQLAPFFIVAGVLLLIGVLGLLSLRIASIRTRLLLTFSILALLPALAAGGISTYMGVRSMRQAAYTQLSSALQMRQQQIVAWFDSLQPNLINELEIDKQDLLFAGLLAADKNTPEFLTQYDQQLNRFRSSIQLHGVYTTLFFADRLGKIIVSTDPSQPGKTLVNEFYFRSALAGPYTGSPYFSQQLHETAMYAARPVLDVSGQVLGVIGGRVNLEMLRKITGEWSGLGQSGQIYLVAANYALLTPARFNDLSNNQQSFVRSTAVLMAVDERQAGAGEYPNDQGEGMVGAFKWVPELQAALVAERSSSETFRPLVSSIIISALAVFASMVLALIAARFVALSIAQPVNSLTRTAEAIAAGNFDLEANTNSRDEIGTLARAFNAVTARVRQLVATLEQNVADRTTDLEARNQYLQAASKVSIAASSILNSNQLIQQVVDLIQEHFKLYYVGLFMVEESGQWAVLRAGTGLAGQAMQARGHRIQVSSGMIGWCIANSQARVAQEASDDAVRLINPDLPDTRAEAAVPLRSRGRVLGALTVQSDQLDAFDEQALAVLQTMADQVAIALENARLFAEGEESLKTLRRIYGEQSRQTWQSMTQKSLVIGYRRDAHGLLPLTGQDASLQQQTFQQPSSPDSGDLAAAAELENRKLIIPLQLHNQVVGVIEAVKPEGAGEWARAEQELVQALADQLGQALENARLYQDIQNRADRDRLTSQLTARLRESLDVETVLRTAAQQVRSTLGLPEVTVRLIPGGRNGDKK